MTTEKVTKQKDPKRQEASKRGYENKIQKEVNERLAEMKKDIEKHSNGPSHGPSTPSNGASGLCYGPSTASNGPSTASNGLSTTSNGTNTTYVIGGLIIAGIAYLLYSQSSTTTNHAPARTVKPPPPARSQHTIDLSNF